MKVVSDDDVTVNIVYINFFPDSDEIHFAPPLSAHLQSVNETDKAVQMQEIIFLDRKTFTQILSV